MIVLLIYLLLSLIIGYVYYIDKTENEFNPRPVTFLEVVVASLAWPILICIVIVSALLWLGMKIVNSVK